MDEHNLCDDEDTDEMSSELARLEEAIQRARKELEKAKATAGNEAWGHRSRSNTGRSYMKLLPESRHRYEATWAKIADKYDLDNDQNINSFFTMVGYAVCDRVLKGTMELPPKAEALMMLKTLVDNTEFVTNFALDLKRMRTAGISRERIKAKAREVYGDDQDMWPEWLTDDADDDELEGKTKADRIRQGIQSFAREKPNAVVPLAAIIAALTERGVILAGNNADLTQVKRAAAELLYKDKRGWYRLALRNGSKSNFHCTK